MSAKPKKRKKVEVFRLTISGLEEGTSYNDLILDVIGNNQPKQTICKVWSKTHAIMEYTYENPLIYMRVMSYKKGYRPDILDTDDFVVSPNPLRPAQTGVEWTHLVGGYVDGKYYLLLEYNYHGLSSSSLERYFAAIASKYEKMIEVDTKEVNPDPLVVSLEAVPGPEFIKRILRLEIVSAAKVRFVRPNPGWRDLECELGEVSSESNSHKTDISMSAPRGKSLSKLSGIIGWIFDKYDAKTLDYAEVKGKVDGRIEAFNTKKLGKSSYVNIEVDENDQIVSEDIKHVMKSIFDEMTK